MKSFYEPTSEQLERLNGPWCASFSGGKDSTSLVTWVEWLRRSRQITVDAPALVQSDTEVEYEHLQVIASDMRTCLTSSGWTCAVVTPKVHEKLYNRILGIGVTPIYPGIRSMRWCTRSTKIAPMERWRADNSTGLTLTGLRLGESSMRDGKIKRHGCAAGGECGIPEPSERTYSPILHWSTCHVIDWLNGHVASEVRNVMADVFAITQRLVGIYDVRVDSNVFDWADPVVTSARFGCIGCPAIQADRHAPTSSIRRHGNESPLNELYAVWFEARLNRNRLAPRRHGKHFGPIRLEYRKVLFDRVMDIQRRAGVVLITQADEEFIHQCWKNKVYPRGWSEEDELTIPKSETPLLELTWSNTHSDPA